VRAILIDPVKRNIQEIDVARYDSDIDELLKGKSVEHYAHSNRIPDHVLLISENGVIRKKRVWWFANQVIWGRGLLVSRGPTFWEDTRCSVEQVKPLVRFDPLTYGLG
jgi:hypothetical protein